MKCFLMCVCVHVFCVNNLIRYSSERILVNTLSKKCAERYSSPNVAYMAPRPFKRSCTRDSALDAYTFTALSLSL